MIKGEEIRTLKFHSDISVLQTEDGKEYALNGWNGEKYTDCWQLENETDITIPNTECVITPIYADFNEDDIQIDIIGWEIDQ